MQRQLVETLVTPMLLQGMVQRGQRKSPGQRRVGRLSRMWARHSQTLCGSPKDRQSAL